MCIVMISHHLDVLGVMIARSAKEVADECKIIVTMLPASQHVQDVYTGPAGIFQWVVHGCVLCKMLKINGWFYEQGFYSKAFENQSDCQWMHYNG